MKTYNVYRKYASVHMARHNKPIQQKQYVGTVEAASLVSAIKEASQLFCIAAILLTGEQEKCPHTASK